MKKQQMAKELIMLQKDTLKTQNKKLKSLELAFKRNILCGAALKKEISGCNTKIDMLEKQLAKKNEEIKQVEKTLEGTIDQQYEEIQKLRTQLEHARNSRVGKFYVFNPLKDKPRKVYENYAAALADAKAVSKLTNGQKILVLKIVSGVQILENYEDYSLKNE